MNQLHCCIFALSGNCEHINQENSHIKCLTCFSFFKRNVLPLLKTANKELYKNNKYEVASMMAAVPNLSNVVTHYYSHRLHANMKFSAIEKNMQSMKTDPSIIYMVPYHKKYFR